MGNTWQLSTIEKSDRETPVRLNRYLQKGRRDTVKPWSLLLAVLLIFSTGVVATPDYIKMTTSYWPPYVAPELEHDGQFSERLRQAFAAVNIQLDIGIFPWRRAVRYIDIASAYSGYFPEYAQTDSEDRYYCSNGLMTASLALAQSRHRPLIRWQQLEELAPYRIGIVDGYSNTPQFDRLASQGTLQTSSSHTDLMNLRKLAYGRVDLALIDPEVFHYLLRNESSLQPIADQLILQPTPLATQQLVACFRHDEAGRQLRDKLNEGIQLLISRQAG